MAEPRGFCAGVERAIGMVERALEIHGEPVYVRKQIVHNQHVVSQLEKRGAIFVDSEEEVPEGSVCIFSAHGVSPEVRDNAQTRSLDVIDATCPLVSKVHQEAKRFAGAGHTILLVGHKEHEEVEGTFGEAPENTIIVETLQDARELAVPEGDSLSYLTQTTLSVDETSEIIEELVRRFPHIRGPHTADICYASTNRQNAVKELAATCDVVLVVGSDNSSNSVRMVEVAQQHGARSWLCNDVSRLQESWLEGATKVGVTSGASAPEILVQQLVERLGELGYGDTETLTHTTEDMFFAMPGRLS
ncbi:4-hydroxy-3-methylbut-2-enyl diphosphate reductase [Streptomyces sp. WMMC897]|uniref:4-hydroxy-3-methylbut-2-enyl diphosphate reductase n=1 Tax=Streptomyces sp. WMMC897 TaxID=3014782 RepID=UPI0022B6B0E2|nr:4-hydroxy-3-methylbut-2-enyl diphosphate reductase [Streptomyces sp. WMMC897]MCZ7414532.1 4-hydroxy-3-methylbut-2-enyl diphosphate reductase [Streptomyces sp. WMMC897]